MLISFSQASTSVLDYAGYRVLCNFFVTQWCFPYEQSMSKTGLAEGNVPKLIVPRPNAFYEDLSHYFLKKVTCS